MKLFDHRTKTYKLLMFVMGEVSPPLVYMSSIQWRASPYSCTLPPSLPNPGHPRFAPVFLNTSDNFNSNELEIAFTCTNMVRFFKSTYRSRRVL